MAYIDNNDGTITDTTTGLMWQQETLSTMSYDNAILTCSELDLAGHKDWRLPTIKELVSIVDYDRRNPACDPIFGSVSYNYWSSTPGQYSPGGAWLVYFNYGHVDCYDRTHCYSVRAVRTAS